jgi:hypothetical protein
MLVYNAFLSAFCLRDYPKASVCCTLLSPSLCDVTIPNALLFSLSLSQSVGVLVHIPLTVAFFYWLKTSTTFFSF